MNKKCKKINIVCVSVFQGERGTGYGVALLLSLFGNSSDNPLLKSVSPTTQV